MALKLNLFFLGFIDQRLTKRSQIIARADNRILSTARMPAFFANHVFISEGFHFAQRCLGGKKLAYHRTKPAKLEKKGTFGISWPAILRSCRSKQGKSAGELRPDDAKKTALKPKGAVRRILTAAGAELPDKEAFWQGYHMKRFVNHTRKHGELGGCVFLINRPRAGALRVKRKGAGTGGRRERARGLRGGGNLRAGN